MWKNKSRTIFTAVAPVFYLSKYFFLAPFTIQRDGHTTINVRTGWIQFLISMTLATTMVLSQVMHQKWAIQERNGYTTLACLRTAVFAFLIYFNFIEAHYKAKALRSIFDKFRQLSNFIKLNDREVINIFKKCVLICSLIVLAMVSVLVSYTINSTALTTRVFVHAFILCFVIRNIFTPFVAEIQLITLLTMLGTYVDCAHRELYCEDEKYERSRLFVVKT